MERGTKLLGAGNGLLAAIGAVLILENRVLYEEGSASARSLLGEERFEKILQEGLATSTDQAIELALSS